ncbi:MAG: MiaB/RimO family radical SAM methylthiotransferase [Acidobacteriota bacterium]|nr:MiaB/RimO family radical SAM methylthiotransferase [Acidobacteriota bacterium]
MSASTRPPVTYAVVTFGCRVNQADSHRIEEQLLAAGAAAAPAECADLVVVNTCSVTASADQGARQAIRRVARTNPTARIVVTGCYASRAADEIRALPGVARVVANPDKETLGGLLDGEFALTTAARFGDGDGACGAAVGPGLAGRTAYTLRVQTGCEEQCAYCIIPRTRGASRSRPLTAVLAEVARAAAAGFLEVALTGVHLGAWGRDLDPPASLAGLLEALMAGSWDVRFRVSSLEPMDCPPALVDLACADARIAPHFHLPLQHASDGLLRAMRRPYTLGAFDRLVGTIRARLPHASIGSDVIIGFPGESPRDVDRLLSYLAGSPLTHVHVFPYSDRPGTVAAALPDKVRPVDVRDRARAVREVARRLTAAFQLRQIGTVRPGLTLEDGTLAVTDNFLKVRIPPGQARNAWVHVRLLECGDAGGTLIGEVAGGGSPAWAP